MITNSTISRSIVICGIFASTLFLSCKDEENPTGDFGDLIFDRTSLVFSASESVDTIKCEKTGWGVKYVKVFDEKEERLYQNEFFMHYYDNGDIIQGFKYDFAKDWFSLRQWESDPSMLEIRLQPNELDMERSIRITVDAVVHWPVDIWVLQKAD